MIFSINFIDDAIRDLPLGEKALPAEVKIGSFKERIIIPTSYWSKEDYMHQWVEGVRRVLGDSHATSSLVTEMYDPNKANFICWWPLYRDADIVRIQNQILFFDELAEPFQINKLYSFVGKREATSEEGEKISEWEVSIEDLKVWLQLIEGAQR